MLLLKAINIKDRNNSNVIFLTCYEALQSADACIYCFNLSMCTCLELADLCGICHV